MVAATQLGGITSIIIIFGDNQLCWDEFAFISIILFFISSLSGRSSWFESQIKGSTKTCYHYELWHIKDWTAQVICLRIDTAIIILIMDYLVNYSKEVELNYCEEQNKDWSQVFVNLFVFLLCKQPKVAPLNFMISLEQYHREDQISDDHNAVIDVLVNYEVA
jgi:hypothetical protein